MIPLPLQSEQQVWQGLAAIGKLYEGVASLFNMGALKWALILGSIGLFVLLLTARRWHASAMTTAALEVVTKRAGRRLWTIHPAAAVGVAIVVPAIVWTLAPDPAQWVLKWGTVILAVQYLWRAAVYKALGKGLPPVAKEGEIR